MGFISWINAVKYVSKLSDGINHFETEKHIDYLVNKMEPGAEEIIKKELIKGFNKKITPDNVNRLGDKYLYFCKKLLPNTNLIEIEDLLNEAEVKAKENLVRAFANTQLDENECLSPEGVQKIIEFSKANS